MLNVSLPFLALSSSIEQAFGEIDQVFSAATRGTASPNVNIHTTPEAVVVAFEVPGRNPADLKLEITGEELHLTAPEQAISGAEDATHVRGRQQRPAIDCRVHLPESVADDQVQASYRDGILVVTLPRQDRPTSRTVDITTD